MNNLQNAEIRVSTNVLAEQVTTVLQRISKIEKHFQNMEDLVGRSGSYWIGDGGDAHRRVYSESKEGIETVLNNIRETAYSLDVIVQNYRQTESGQKTYSMGLPSNFID